MKIHIRNAMDQGGAVLPRERIKLSESPPPPRAGLIGKNQWATGLE